MSKFGVAFLSLIFSPSSRHQLLRTQACDGDASFLGFGKAPRSGVDSLVGLKLEVYKSFAKHLNVRTCAYRHDRTVVMSTAAVPSTAFEHSQGSRFGRSDRT